MKTNGGSPNGASRRSPFDRWFRYPAGFSQDTLQQCSQELGDQRGLLIDPFAGVATTGTWAVEQGYTYRGIETHPLIAEIASLKLRTLSAEALRALETTADEILRSLKGRRARISEETELVRRSFERQTLGQLISLRELISTSDSDLRPYLRCALAATLRDVASVRVGWPYQMPSVPRRPVCRLVSKRFRQRVKWVAEDLATLPGNPDARVMNGDSRRLSVWTSILDETKASICLSSPPYLNNFDYADATRLEVYFLGVARTWADLCDRVRINMVASTTQQSTRGRAEQGWAELDAVRAIKATLERLCARLTEERKERSRGKEYDQTVPAYFADIAAVLRNAHAYLATDGLLAWVIGDSAPYGVYVDTPTLVKQMAAELGFSPVKDVVLRSRGRRWTQNGTRHQVALSERLIVMGKTSRCAYRPAGRQAR